MRIPTKRRCDDTDSEIQHSVDSGKHAEEIAIVQRAKVRLHVLSKGDDTHHVENEVDDVAVQEGVGKQSLY